jgi:hypothetical protein
VLVASITQARRAALGLLVALSAAGVLAPNALASLPQEDGNTSFDSGFNLHVIGSPGQQLGTPVYVGDVNGDGIGDWAIGVPTAENPELVDQAAGAVYVIYGRRDAPGTAITTSSIDAGSSNGFAVYGAVTGDDVGASVAAAGDVNGDSLADIVIGAPGSDSDVGGAFVIYGSRTGGDVQTFLLGSRGYSIVDTLPAATNANLGYSVAGAGDVNGDGLDDVAVSAPGYGASGASGAVWIIFGAASQSQVDLNVSMHTAARTSTEPADLSPIDATNGAWVAVFGSGSDHIGNSIAGVGDFNGDGHPDIAFTFQADALDDSGGVDVQYLVPHEDSENPAFDSVFSFSSHAGSNELKVINSVVAGAGDFDGDGLSDIIVGDGHAAGGGTLRGTAYVVLGRHSTPGTAPTAEFTNAFTGFTVAGPANSDALGATVGGGRDVNGDGIDDVVIGVPGASTTSGTGAGEALVVYGRAASHTAGTGQPIDLSGVADGADGFVIAGSSAGDSTGGDGLSIGDVNGDGRPDVLVAAPSDADGGANAGAAAVVEGFGTPDLTYASINGTVGTALSVTPSAFSHTGPAQIMATNTLPAGLSLDSSSGVISGTPTVAGTGTYNVTMSDQASSTATTVSITVAPASGPPLTCPDGEVGTPPNCTHQQPPPPAKCVVPGLRGKALAAARRALTAAHCAAGKVIKPRHKRKRKHGVKLVTVVTGQTPKPGAQESAGTKVNLTLGYTRVKVKKHRH